MILKDKIILTTLQKKNIPEDVAFLILEYYKNIVNINNEIDINIKKSDKPSHNKIQTFFVYFCVFGIILLLTSLIVLNDHTILNDKNSTK